MKTEFTPGPWHIELPSRWSGDSFGIYAGTEVKPNWICETHGIRFQNEPNARLIAAAPELFEVLLEVNNRYASLMTEKMKIKMQSAINKAKGKSQ